MRNLQSYFASLGLGYELYQNDDLSIRMGDQLTLAYTHADYDPLNSVAESSARVLENRLSLTAFDDLADATTIDADISLVNLIVAQQRRCRRHTQRVCAWPSRHRDTVLGGRYERRYTTQTGTCLCPVYSLHDARAGDVRTIVL